MSKLNAEHRNAVSKETKRRLNCEISGDIDEMLEGIAKRLNVSKTEVIKKGVRLMDLAVTASEKGEALQVKDKQGNSQNIMFL